MKISSSSILIRMSRFYGNTPSDLRFRRLSQSDLIELHFESKKASDRSYLDSLSPESRKCVIRSRRSKAFAFQYDEQCLFDVDPISVASSFTPLDYDTLDLTGFANPRYI